MKLWKPWCLLQLFFIAPKLSYSNEMDFPFLFKDPDKKVKSLVKKITHSGETELDKESLAELKDICKRIENDIVVLVFRECMKCLAKEHSQVRVSTVKLIDYLFQKSHVIREKVLDNFDTFLELTLAISNKPKVKFKLPPPKKFAALLQELTAKTINTWHSDYGPGYEKLRYAYKFLKEHQLVDFSAFRVRTHEDLIKRQKLADRQEKILSRSIENRLKEFQTLRPEIDELIAQIESLIDLLTSSSNLSKDFLDETKDQLKGHQEETADSMRKEEFGIISNLSQSVEIEFSPYIEVSKNENNRDLVENLREMKKQLAESKLPKLVAIEKTLIKRSEDFVRLLKEIIDLKSKATNVILKLSELKIINDEAGRQNSSKTLDAASDSDSEFEDVAPKEGLESYIPKSMRLEYGLEAIDLREIDEERKVVLVDESFTPEAGSSSCGFSSGPVMACNVRLESGKLCPRQDKVKCPFHGRIIPRDHIGIPLNEQDRLKEEISKAKPTVPDWQDPELLRDLKAATGVDLTMPAKGRVQKSTKQKKLANTRTCDLTPKQRLQKRLKLLTK